MNQDPDIPAPMLETSAGPFQLYEYRLRQAGREWSILHTGSALRLVDEARVIGQTSIRLPYGVALWPSSVALAHEVAARGESLRGRTVLELGAGTGLPGIVAASMGAAVTQTDRDELALHLCRSNGQRNGVEGVDYRLADWSDWRVAGRFDWIIGADVLYGESLHPRVREILATNLAPGGRILLADPFRPTSLRLMESMEAEGWSIRFDRWDIGEADEPRPVGVFDLTPPAPLG